MKLRPVVILSLVGFAMSVGPVWVGPVDGQGSLSPGLRVAAIAQLEAQRHHVSRQMLMPPYNKGPILIHNMDRYSKLSDLINRLQSGRPVATDELDRALQAPN